MRKRDWVRGWWVVVTAGALMVCAAPSLASAEPEIPAGAPSEPEQVEDPGLPDLDELLGLPSTSKPRQPDATTPAETDKELQRRLTAQELGDAFKQAITLMGDAAERLEKRRDSSLNTQRVQEDVLRRLDELISQLERSSQQQQQQSSSSSSQQRDDPRNSDEAGRQEQQQQTPADQAGADNTGQVNPPPFQEGALRPALESAPAAWGALPARIRDMLLQGAGDRFSTTWERATESYYRRLAEQRPE
ncbi:MAG: hypothetical protein KF768_05305 [Phycisphaeraceae bacterium]|nr:hypothetical protein [Phycisphaeraceae bacterium]